MDQQYIVHVLFISLSHPANRGEEIYVYFRSEFHASLYLRPMESIGPLCQCAVSVFIRHPTYPQPIHFHKNTFTCNILSIHYILNPSNVSERSPLCSQAWFLIAMKVVLLQQQEAAV